MIMLYCQYLLFINEFININIKNKKKKENDVIEINICAARTDYKFY